MHPVTIALILEQQAGWANDCVTAKARDDARMGDIVSLEDYRKWRQAQAAWQTSPRPTRPKGARELPLEERSEGAKNPAEDKPRA